MSTRSAALADAFRATPLTCGELVLRPLTAGSMMLLMETGNVLFETPLAPDGAPAALTQAQEMAGFFAYIYLHTAPLEDILTATRDNIHDRARRISLNITFENLTDFIGQFGALRERLAAATVSLIPEADAPPKKPAPSPTGSLASSTPSAPPATPPANITSFGPVLSSAPSSTPTRPISPTATVSAGPSPSTPPEPLLPGEKLELLP